MLTLAAFPPRLLGAETVEPMTDEDCLLCHDDTELTRTDANGDEVSVYVDPAMLAASAHATNSCSSCHEDITWDHPDDEVTPKPVSCARCHEDAADTYQGSVHGLAIADGDDSAPTCVDCHGTHDVSHPTSADSPLHWSHLADTCGGCHPDAAADVESSVHGQAVGEGRREAATCTDCHSEHRIEALKGVSSIKLATVICAKCHESERINTKFRMPTQRLESFFESYHGLAVRRGDTHAANCASCHGYHRILASSDPDSTINPKHLVETCGECHPGASENFTLGKVHQSADDDGVGPLVNRWVRQVYLVLIFVVVGLMVLHNGAAWLRSVMKSLRSSRRQITRMERSERIQHFVLLSSFILLAVTGFALKFPDSWLGVVFGADDLVRRWLHRIAGVVLLGAGFYHVLYVTLTRRGRQLVRDFAPSTKDLKDIGENVHHMLDHSRKAPRFGRFGYVEKMEYWAVVWGTIIMGVSGLMIWFKIPVTEWLPRWAVDVATTVHYYEAILACLSIIVWHFYHVIFAPGVYPINWAWWDGKVTRKWYEHEHPDDPAIAQFDEEQRQKEEAP
ncbi:MAG: cytochrome b/b6 domain-containing protein [Verrucomicrobiales bacterium]|nr:cytochrome b/b6 domain-containing protein [Verrucomicrobiales bacterium]